ncbi:septal ring lytic transglycosylase RlpA family protein [Aquirufa antheringensis]|jgi:LysM repeat protein|uniref:LysM peptidoglycan-binding domain-containing protein n=1 Tax=Aquirufa antheringensis TaxID=2516559 RepID=A0A4Q9B879_9BACT|nr:septal ring lytic transglycosylase RlpA family protein [Aquirufa antheringensis]MCZ2485738.1 LysM peptidoglycan-binding domain-containing protein [Aquirufa antheringensis]MCZ2486569.1 LysM peptidoglycan-binding domain-containing protein [Aquirufa antheringensis]MCZ2488650.1 LysM peptidoglycan-binding domain-containing protein [Aquirufa antheringensis]TBH71126.1 LysM peptidoglycan-binding domain-containing protein [Aquirufa antheringensis]
MKNYKLTLLIAFLFALQFSTEASTLDSLGLKKENNKTFLLFKVGPKQSLFSILKRYNLSLTEFKSANTDVQIPVKTGEIVYIPLHYLEESNPAPKVVEEKAAESTKEAEIHIVAPKQGLLSVANMHKVTMAELRKWNNLTSDRLQEGQRLIVSDPAGSTSSIAVDKSNLLPAKAAAPTAPAPTEAVVAPAKEKGPEDIKKKIETGIAELIDVPDNSGKFLALHRTAPIGTLVLVKNLTNNQSIWVKVIGRLPNGDNKVIIKLSPKAFEKLNAVDKRVRAEISYLLQ